MERLDAGFTQYWSELRAALIAHLTTSTPTFFLDLAEPDTQMIKHLIGGGKNLRGCTVLAVCDALGGSIDSALPAAVAIECVHSASLIHDDLVDGDKVRRDRPAAWIIHGSRRAVLLGDVMFATALVRCAELGREEVLTLSRAIAMLAAGAYKEPLNLSEVESSLTENQPAPALYEQIIGLKTGALFAASAELGAIAAQATPVLRQAAFEFGARVGEAYQIADDLQDIVNRGNSRMLSQPQAATLAILRAHFDARPNRYSALGSTDVVNRIDHDFVQLTGAMEAEIRRRIALARRALAPFAERPSLAFLHALPAAIVQPVQSLTAVTMAEPNNVR
jgi:geranylgeranyl pyrophosphate synthase